MKVVRKHLIYLNLHRNYTKEHPFQMLLPLY
jgi:hypothetical protein